MDLLTDFYCIPTWNEGLNALWKGRVCLQHSSAFRAWLKCYSLQIKAKRISTRVEFCLEIERQQLSTLVWNIVRGTFHLRRSLSFSCQCHSCSSTFTGRWKWTVSKLLLERRKRSLKVFLFGKRKKSVGWWKNFSFPFLLFTSLVFSSISIYLIYFWIHTQQSLLLQDVSFFPPRNFISLPSFMTSATKALIKLVHLALLLDMILGNAWHKEVIKLEANLGKKNLSNLR